MRNLGFSWVVPLPHLGFFIFIEWQWWWWCTVDFRRSCTRTWVCYRFLFCFFPSVLYLFGVCAEHLCIEKGVCVTAAPVSL